MWGFTVIGSWRSNITAIFWPPLLWPWTLCLSSSPGAQPEVQRPLCWVMAFFTASYQHLLRTSTHQGIKAPLAWRGFPYHILSITPSDLQLNWPELELNCNSTGTWLLSYIIVQRPLDRPLVFWNRMFNRHQAEITVMQFRGHSLPVHQSMSVSWALPCPISSANFRPRDFLS